MCGPGLRPIDSSRLPAAKGLYPSTDHARRSPDSGPSCTWYAKPTTLTDGLERMAAPSLGSTMCTLGAFNGTVTVRSDSPSILPSTLMTWLPLGLLALRAVAITASQFFDPCFQWGIGNSSSGTIRRDDPCRSRSGASETKTQAVARMLILPGGILAGLALGILGRRARGLG
jgi:hypothetical protein